MHTVTMRMKEFAILDEENMSSKNGLYTKKYAFNIYIRYIYTFVEK